MLNNFLKVGMTLLIATNNPGKFSELSTRISKHTPTISIKDLNIDADIDETGKTFEENAALKAQFFANRSGIVALADDSGLCIDALNGAPGIYSKRFAGDHATDEQRIEKVLECMKDIPDDKRSASFVAVLAVATPDGKVNYYKGCLQGMISREPRGALIPGLPYKTIFFLPEFGKTLAELDEQNISYVCHRDKAITQLLADLNNKMLLNY